VFLRRISYPGAPISVWSYLVPWKTTPNTDIETT
jgi:hypothetical protein